MKQIENYVADKYSDNRYIEIEEGIYKINENILYITSLSY